MDKTLLLVDGSSYLYRAFHAMPDLRNKAGEPTGALYGIINMLKRLRADYPSATHLACVFDAKGKTFRDDLYPDYKANRPSMPEDLRAQIEPIHEAVGALGWPVLAIEGVEADDVIATYAHQATQAGWKTIVSTGDKDLAQLVDDHVTLVNTMSNEKLDRMGVIAKFGVPPERIVDYLALIGDSVDNVPGVEKCGPKTAVKWLTEYGTLDDIIAKAESIKGVVGENLRKALPMFPMTRELLTVKRDVSGIVPIDGLDAMPIDLDTLAGVSDRYGLRSLLRELTGDAQAIPKGDARVQDDVPAPGLGKADARYEAVLTWEAFDAWLSRIQSAELVSLDTETTSIEEMQARLVGISLCVEAGHACYIPLAHRYPDAPAQLPFDEVLARLKPWLEDTARPKLLQHAKYDMHVLANHGVALAGVVHDTMLASYVLESHKSSSLDALAERWLSRKGLTYEEVCGKGANQIGFDEVSVERATEYSAEDADLTLQVHQRLWPRIQADSGLARIYALELACQPVLFEIERTGVSIDAQRLADHSHAMGVQMMALEQQAYEQAGQPFNLNSPKQLGELFFDKLKLPVVKKTATGAPSTDEEVLTKLAEDFPLPKVILEYRGLAKLKSTYADKLPKMIHPATGRVHTHYAQAAVVTGRLSSSDPNLQNIPVRTAEGRKIREAFIAPPGKRIISADYSQIELRIMAHISGDASLKRAFAEGEDVHRATASEIFGVARDAVTSEQRRYAKVINFGLIYGMSAFGLASNLGIERDAAKHYIDTYFARYPGVAAYMERTRVEAKQHGYVQTAFGRRLWLPEINSPNGPRRQGAERAAINAPMQGTAADLIKMAMVDISAWLHRDGLQSRMVMQVHDELVLEVPEAELLLMKTQVTQRMAGVAQLDVPLLAEVGEGSNWEEAH
ncbi:DNA polymerase I [Piscinibacterium candidicorallinum]|uniref:DNA polymerase I n=1 Tax=Piscinibacterium candidicorallinum TaxID=1793872 RepID=A0ABV7GXJ9_9BURK